MTRTLLFTDRAPEPSELEDGMTVVVTDDHWTAPLDGDGRVIGLRDVVAEVLAGRDLFDESLRRLDEWAERAGIEAVLAADGLSFWHRRRLGYWWWLQARLVWLDVLAGLVAAHHPDVLAIRDRDPGLADLAPLAAARHGLRFDPPPAAAHAAAGGVTAPTAGGTRPPGVVARLRLWGRRTRAERRHSRVLAAARGGVLVLEAPDNRQLVATGGEVRYMNPFLDPVVDELASAGVPFAILDLAADHADAQLDGHGPRHADRHLPADLLARRFAAPDDAKRSADGLAAVLERLAQVREPLDCGGVDLGPALVGEIRRTATGQIGGRLRDIARGRRLLRSLAPSAVLLVNEYGRSEWIGAARLEGIPSVAVQHGIIHRWHVGYRHRRRSAELPLPDRTCVFGDYERRLLVEHGVYRAEEVVVTGSPRLDVAPQRAEDREEVRIRVRSDLGIEPGARMLLVSTTSAEILRRFYVLPALAALFRQAHPGVHVVIKLHPGESDGDLYRRLFERLDADRGGDPTPLSIVKRADLYELLRAADAHLSSYSTVLTEAVAAGTPNLIAMTHASADLLGYVEAGVAVPVATGDDLDAALAAIDAGAIHADAQTRFVADHYRPGLAAPRVREVLREVGLARRG